MQGTVQEFTKNQNGRTKVKIDGGWYNVGNKCDIGPTSVMIGERIEFDASNSPFNGKDVWWLNKYAKIPGGEPQHNQPAASSLHPYVAPSGSLDEPLRQTFSNIAGNMARAGAFNSLEPLDLMEKLEILAGSVKAAHRKLAE